MPGGLADGASAAALRYAGLALASALTVLLFTLAIARWRQGRTVQQRLARFGLLTSAGLAEASTPTTSDYLAQLGQLWAARLGAAQTEALRQTLARAGLAERTSVPEFLGLRLVAIATLAAVGGVLLGLVAAPWLLGALVGAAAGYALPGVVLDRLQRGRRAAVERLLPDAVDVLVLSLEAGLSFDGAIGFLCERADNPLVEEFRRYLADLRLGRSRREALEALAERTQSPSLHEFAAAVVQAEELGTGLARALRGQARALRAARRVRAEEQARQAPIKLLFPIVIFIMPMLFIVIIGPAILAAIALLGQP